MLRPTFVSLGWLPLLVAAVTLAALRAEAFPDGAPVDACVKPKPNQPYHGQADTQAVESLPYQLLASDSVYAPGSVISVSIDGGGVPFKGFFVQARDANTDQWIGEWVHSPNTTVHPECASVTHADPKDKLKAAFQWVAPNDVPGGKSRVYFTGTVLKDYGTYWANLIAGAPR